LVTDRIPAGAYSVKIGVLPSKNLRPNLIHPVIKAITMESNEIVLLDEKENKGSLWVNKTYENNITGYDSVLIADTLVIPDGTVAVAFYLSSEVDNDNYSGYSSILLLDRIFFEPVNKDSASYTGPFTKEVLNRAALYVPTNALSAYQAADGWKYFKTIKTVNTTTRLIATDKNNSYSDNLIIHDITGRRVKVDTIEQLSPGLYIIDNRKYLVK
jgi:hypothetical protein